MSASVVTCFLPCPLSSNKGQMIRGGTALPPSTAFFCTSRTTKVNKSPMKVVAATTILEEPITEVNGSGRPAQADLDPVLLVGKPEETKFLINMEVVTDNDDELVVEYHLRGLALSEDEIETVVSFDHNYLIIEGKKPRAKAGENASGSFMWSKEVVFDHHFRLPEEWDKKQGIKGKYNEAREVLTVTVPKSKLPKNAGIIWE